MNVIIHKQKITALITTATIHIQLCLKQQTCILSTSEAQTQFSGNMYFSLLR